ncbi:amidase family protein [Cellulomonas biazotea]|uniref:amidase family protein n=2 Tax=Cellulomonas biazotea TaxID=1709 RepID=UPI0035EC6D89
MSAAPGRAPSVPDGSGPSALDGAVWRTVGDPLVAGAPEGPLRGLTVAVKDLFAVAGHRVGAGNPTWLRDARTEPEHAHAVADLLRGGASVRGIARTDELAYSVVGDNAHYGTPPNGAAPGAMPGGSSSGPASAVATGQVDVGLGSDTAGSIRVPASWQGLWGLRTTHGLVPRDGMLPLASSFDTVGWLVRDAATLAAVASWCLGPPGGPGLAPGSGRDPVLAPGRRLRLRVPAEVVAAADPSVADAFAALLDGWRAAGVADVETVEVGPLDRWFDAFRTVQGAEAWRVDGPWVTAHPGALGPALAERFAAAAAVTAADEARARADLDRLRADLRAVVTDALLVLPTTPGPAPARDAGAAELARVRAATLPTTALAGVGGLPALSVPLLTVPTVRGPAPVGVCLVGPASSDLDLVRAGAALAAAGGTVRTRTTGVERDAAKETR